MPALITHYIQADKTLEALPNNISHEIIRPAFLLGAQGPDFLYFHRVLPIIMPGKSQRSVGTALHNIPPDRLFGSFANYLCKNYNAAAMSFALGFLCHYALDSVCHPYIYSLQRKIIEQNNIKYFDGFVHSKIEHSIDILLCRKLLCINANEFDFDKALTNDEQIISECAKMMAYSVNELTEYDVSERQMRRAFLDFRALQRFSRDKHGIKHGTLRTLEKIIFFPESASTFIRTKTVADDVDYLNLAHDEWTNPYDKTSVATSDFYWLINEATNRSVRLIEQYQNAVEDKNIIDFTGNFSYKTGLKISDKSKIDDTY